VSSAERARDLANLRLRAGVGWPPTSGLRIPTITRAIRRGARRRIPMAASNNRRPRAQFTTVSPDVLITIEDYGFCSARRGHFALDGNCASAARSVEHERRHALGGNSSAGSARGRHPADPWRSTSQVDDAEVVCRPGRAASSRAFPLLLTRRRAEPHTLTNWSPAPSRSSSRRPAGMGGTLAEEIRIQRCNTCGHLRCRGDLLTRCLSQTRFQLASGRGRCSRSRLCASDHPDFSAQVLRRRRHQLEEGPS